MGIMIFLCQKPSQTSSLWVYTLDYSCDSFSSFITHAYPLFLFELGHMESLLCLGLGGISFGLL
jgi:hypothetical protein